MGYRFYCPGCGCHHVYYVPRWTFNGNIENPTFSPSLLNRIGDIDANGILINILSVCHIFVIEGKIQYLGDCTHKLAGQTIEMEAAEDEEDILIGD